MSSVYRYFDNREFLRDELAGKKRKNPVYSVRAAARRLGVNSGTLTRLLNGTRRLGPDLLPRVIDFLGLKRREAEYFTLLVHFNQTADAAAKKTLYLEILKRRGENRRIIPEEHYEFFTEWYYSALHELIRIHPGIHDCATLGALLNPPITGPMARRAIEAMIRLGFVKKNHGGGFSPTEQFVTTAETWKGVAIHSFQAAMAGMAVRALDRFPKEERDFSTLTVSLSPASFDRARSALKHAWEEIAGIEKTELSPDRVYHVNLQLFPLSNRTDKERGRP
jgi:uncharacterized protein (TIGR02147 family)